VYSPYVRLRYLRRKSRGPQEALAAAAHQREKLGDLLEHDSGSPSRAGQANSRVEFVSSVQNFIVHGSEKVGVSLVGIFA
jgi:hypothetical protein